MSPMSRMSPIKRRVLVVTGSRAEFGLLRPVMDAVKKHKRLRLLVAVAGEHLLRPALTWREVAKAYRIDAKVPMQRQGDRGRVAHAAAAGRGVEGFARAYKRLKPDWVVVLGDRVEAFAAASAASIAGIAVCHIHGGDRAEGIADEAMRHAITKLAHLHCAATKKSAQRIVAMGERKQAVHNTGSPAIDGLSDIEPLTDDELGDLGAPKLVVLLHPSGLSPKHDRLLARSIDLLTRDTPSLFLMPNGDPGHEVIRNCWQKLRPALFERRVLSHLPRTRFIGLMKRLAFSKSHHIAGSIVGNSSSALIEAAALGLPALNLGPRQAGRERGSNVVDVEIRGNAKQLAARLDALLFNASLSPPSLNHPFGDGRAGPRIAALLAQVNPHDPALLRKRNAY